MNATINPFNPTKKPYLYTVLYNGNKFRQTDNENTALKWSVKYNGQTYIDVRYKARLRLYWYLWRKENYKNK